MCKTGLSKKARRRQAKKDEHRRLQEARAARSKQREDEEFLRIAQRVSRLNQEEGTVVKEECLESIQALDVALRKEEAKDTQSPSKNSRRRDAFEDVNAAILQLNLWQASMKYGE